MYYIACMNTFELRHFNWMIYFDREVPRLKQKIAGKSIPIEKFAVFKAKRFTEQNGYLTLPALVYLIFTN